MSTTSETLYPVGPAARRVGYSPEWLRELCDRGEVQHIRDAGNRRLIPESELDRIVLSKNHPER